MKKSFVFSAIGSFIIIAFLFTLNYITSWTHPWFLYPTFVVLWWPLAMFFSANRDFKAFSLAGSILVTAFFFLVNMITSSVYPWFIYPTFVMWWWPMSMYIAGKKRFKLFSVVASLYSIAFFLTVNIVSSPNVIWFIYPAFALIWWPMSQIICGAKKYKLYSVVASLYVICFLALVNYITSPGYVWFYYPAYAIAWWPLSMFLLKKKSAKVYSLTMTLLTVAFLAAINLLNTPEYMWFQYTLFYFMWWPLSMLLGNKAKTFGFAVVGAALIIAYHVMLYYIQTPLGHPWYLYIILPAIWWPVCMALRRHISRVWFLLLSLAVFVGYYVTLNLILLPNYFWSIYIIYPVLWAVMGLYFGRRKKYFAMSVCASIVTIAFFTLINYITSPNSIWAIYPSFAILWWPLSLYFYRIKKQGTQNILKEKEAL